MVLDFVRLFDDQGKQGCTGLVRLFDDPDDDKGELVVFKFAQYMTYLTDHETRILEGLQQYLPYCPHFTRLIGHQMFPIHPSFQKLKNPFDVSHARRILHLPVLLLEYIPKSFSLSKLIQDKNYPFGVILTSIKQVLIALQIVRSEQQFVHYDLHSENILLRFTNRNVVHLYRFDDHHIFYVPTFGHIPVIIDVGFASSNKLTNVTCPMAFTEAGYRSPIYDPLNDIKRFLISLCEDFRLDGMDKSDVDQIQRFRTILKNCFVGLSVDWRSGWEQSDENELSIEESFIDYLLEEDEPATTFARYPHACFDYLFYLVEIPLEQRLEPSLRQMRHAYKMMMVELRKIEQSIGGTFFTLYIFSLLIHFIADNRARFENPTTRADVMIETLRHLQDWVVPLRLTFCTFSDVDIERLLVSCYCLGDCMQTQIVEIIRMQWDHLETTRQEIPLTQLEEFITLLDTMLDDVYEITAKTEFHLFDIENKRQEIFTAEHWTPTQLRLANECPTLLKGIFINTLSST